MVNMGEKEDAEIIVETLLKGLIVQLFDQLLSEDALKSTVTMMKALKPAVSSVEDAVFGHIIGEFSARIKSSISSALKRDPSESELGFIADAIIRRSIEIKSEVRKYANL